MGEEEDGEAAVLTELLTAVMSGNTKALGSLIDRVREGEVGRFLRALLASDTFNRHCCLHKAFQSVEVEVKKGKKEPVEQLVNTQFGASKASCLHLAAKEGHRYTISFMPSS